MHDITPRTAGAEGQTSMRCECLAHAARCSARRLYRDLGRLRGMKIIYLPHARRRMDERGIAQWEVAAVLEAPGIEYPGHFLERTVAERVLPGRRLAVKVVYNLGAQDERIVVTVELGRPTLLRRSRSPAEPEGGEQ